LWVPVPDPGPANATAPPRTRLLAVCTHPVQYLAPLFRVLTDQHPEIDLEVLYITKPTPDQQGQGFGVSFEWDVALMGGYRSRVLRESRAKDDFLSWGGLDARGIGHAIEEAKPDVVLLPGWHCRALVRALFACNRLGIPVLYRGDTSLWQKPRGTRGLLWSGKNRFLLRRFSGFLAVGKRARIFLRENGISEERILDSLHAVDSARIKRDANDALTAAGRARVRGELGFRATDFVVLLVGKLEPRKDPETAIRALAEIGGDAILAVCGSGELETRCREVAAESGARVAWLGFRNQSDLPRIYAAADALILPSVSETWGLAVNEAMAVGTPCVVSDAAGCAPDLIEPGVTGEVFPSANLSLLVDGLQRIRTLASDRRYFEEAIRAKDRSYSLQGAADGIARLATRVVQPGWPPAPPKRCRVLAMCDGMAMLGGMERRSLEILDYVASAGARLHCIVSREPAYRFRISHRIEQSTHSWSGARSMTGFFTGDRSVRWVSQLLRDILSTSGQLLVACALRRPQSLFLWSFGSALKSWPVLLPSRWLGLRVVLRSGNAPAAGSRQRWIWKWLVDPVVDLHVANSDFIASQLAATGISRRKIRVVRNVVPESPVAAHASRHEGRIIYVGQIIPEKGVLEFLEALALLQRRDIRFTACLVGRVHGWEHSIHKGYKEAVRAKVAALGHETVQLLGEREDVLFLMRSAAVHCCPSQERQREGLANVVLQAKAAGIPSVVTPSGALPEMVRHRVDGWVCRGFASEDIAEGLAHFLLNAEAARSAGQEAGRWREVAYLPGTVERQWRELLCLGAAVRSS
jgi:glycosyltransferase involved in cell wall biosynthesis